MVGVCRRAALRGVFGKLRLVLMQHPAQEKVPGCNHYTKPKKLVPAVVTVSMMEGDNEDIDPQEEDLVGENDDAHHNVQINS